MEFLSRVQVEAIAARFVDRDVRVECDRGALLGTVRGVAVAADGEVRLVVQGVGGEPWGEDPRPEDVELL